MESLEYRKRKFGSFGKETIQGLSRVLAEVNALFLRIPSSCERPEGQGLQEVAWGAGGCGSPMVPPPCCPRSLLSNVPSHRTLPSWQLSCCSFAEEQGEAICPASQARIRNPFSCTSRVLLGDRVLVCRTLMEPTRGWIGFCGQVWGPGHRWNIHPIGACVRGSPFRWEHGLCVLEYQGQVPVTEGGISAPLCASFCPSPGSSSLAQV